MFRQVQGMLVNHCKSRLPSLKTASWHLKMVGKGILFCFLKWGPLVRPIFREVFQPSGSTEEPIGEVWIRIQATEGSSCSTRTCKDRCWPFWGHDRNWKQENWMLFWKAFYVLLCFISFLVSFFAKTQNTLEAWLWMMSCRSEDHFSSYIDHLREVRWQEQPDSFPESKQGWLARVLFGKSVFFQSTFDNVSRFLCHESLKRQAIFVGRVFPSPNKRWTFWSWGTQHADGPESFWRRWNKSSATSTAAGSCKTKSMVRGDNQSQCPTAVQILMQHFCTSEDWRSSGKLQSFCCKGGSRSNGTHLPHSQSAYEGWGVLGLRMFGFLQFLFRLISKSTWFGKKGQISKKVATLLHFFLSKNIR